MKILNFKFDNSYKYQIIKLITKSLEKMYSIIIYIFKNIIHLTFVEFYLISITYIKIYNLILLLFVILFSKYSKCSKYLYKL